MNVFIAGATCIIDNNNNQNAFQLMMS